MINEHDVNNGRGGFSFIVVLVDSLIKVKQTFIAFCDYTQWRNMISNRGTYSRVNVDFMKEQKKNSFCFTNVL